MKISSAKWQTILLTAVNTVVRTLGFLMRIWTSRVLGAEGMGIMELAQSIHMVAIAPLTSGLPAAISRLTAKAGREHQEYALESGLWLTRRVSFLLIPALWIFSPLLAKIAGDIRVLPSLWFTAPCILILGYSASFNGYCYGLEKSAWPALSELIEQLVRLGLSIILISLLRHLTLPWLASIPVAATMFAEIIGLLYVIRHFPNIKIYRKPSYAWTRNVIKLSIPATANRMLQTLLRSVTAIIIPARLQISGLTATEATAQLGRLNGMVMPVLMLPGVFTSALSMVLIPKIAKAEEQPSELKRLLIISFGCCIPFSVLSAGAVYYASPILANMLYHQPDLTKLFKFCAFQILLFPINHMLGSTLSALGLQRCTFFTALASAVCSLFLTWLWAGSSRLGIVGIVYAQYASLFLSIILECIALLYWRRKKKLTFDDRSA